MGGGTLQITGMNEMSRIIFYTGKWFIVKWINLRIKYTNITLK